MEGRLGILGMHFCEKGKLPGERGQVEEDGRTLEMRKMPRPGRKHGGEERTKRIFTCLVLKGRVKGWAWWFWFYFGMEKGQRLMPRGWGCMAGDESDSRMSCDKPGD